MKKAIGSAAYQCSLLIALVFLPTVVRSETQVIVWGAATGVTPKPPGLTNVVALAAGDSHALALRADGTVTAWGFPGYDFGQRNVPANATNVVAIAAGTTHSLALRGDGTVVIWGQVWDSPFSNAPPEAAANFAGLALGCGADHVAQLRMDGTVLDWGDTNASHQVTNVPVSVTNIVSVAAGDANTIALRANGTVVGWGSRSSGGSLPVPPIVTNIAVIASGTDHNVAARSNGTVVAWGVNNMYGRLTVPASATNVIGLACGNYFSLALRKDGKVLAWGDNSYGQANVPLTLSNVVDIAGGSTFALALQVTDGPPLLGRPFAPPAVLGTNAILRIKAVSSPPVTYQWTFFGTNLPGATNASLILPNVQFSQAGFYSVIVSNVFGAVTNSEMALGVVPVIVTAPPVSITALIGDNVQLRMTATGQSPLAYQWRLNGNNIPGATSNLLSLANVQLTNTGAYSVTVSNSYGGVVSADGILTVVPTWILTPLQGRSTFPGGTVTFSMVLQANIPVSYQWQFNGTNISGATSNSLTLTNVLFEQAGDYSVVSGNAFEVITNSAHLVVSTVAGWGINNRGQISIPSGLTNIVALAAGNLHSLALKADGTIRAWGGDFPRTNIPPNLTNTVAISAGRGHSLALSADGTVAQWGYSIGGQTNVPTTLTNAQAVAAGGFHSLALKPDGTVVAWGQNTSGQTNVPPGLSNVVAIAGGDYFNLALKNDGTVVAWGSNGNGQTNVPIGLSNVVAIAAGYIHSLALRADGTVAVWGSSGYGLQNIPPSATNVVAIEAGFGHCLALRADGDPIAWGYHYNGETNVPSGLTNVTVIASGEDYNLALMGNLPLTLFAPLSNVAVSNNAVVLSLPTQRGRVYQLQYMNSLSSSTWIAHPLVVGNGGILTLTDPTPPVAQRFYRVRTW